MKKQVLLLGTISLLIWCATAHATTFVSGSTGALGAFNPTANTVVTLPPDGVLNYTIIAIPAGVTVTFTKNAANTPVTMLATGDVIITGTIDVSGTYGSSSDIGRGGPGGFNGGYGGVSNSGGGQGMGPGGGSGANPPCNNPCGGAGGGFGANAAGSFSTNGSTIGGLAYGNARLLPLIGGSGGGGGCTGSTNGGGGGGAILIASSTTITLTGSIIANGGFSSANWWPGSGGGSGGAIKLVANTISGNANLSAASAGGPCSSCYGTIGAVGRIRVEANMNNLIGASNPAYTFGFPTNIFSTNPPALNITSIGGANVPASPTGAYTQPDIILPNTTTNPVAVNVSAVNIPAGTTVTVLVIPQLGGPTTSVNSTLTGTNQASTATASVTLSTAYANVVTAQATFTVTAMNYDGEEINKVRVATSLGGKSETTYITKSGKEIKGELVAALIK